jgi:hypothetical protein
MAVAMKFDLRNYLLEMTMNYDCLQHIFGSRIERVKFATNWTFLHILECAAGFERLIFLTVERT